MDITAMKEQKTSKELAKQIQQRFNKLKEKRESRKDTIKSVEERWKDAVEYCMPMYCDFWEDNYEDKRYDSTATDCIHLLADGMIGSSCPSNSPWLKLRFSENELNDDSELVKWLQEVEERLTESFQRSNFYESIPKGTRVGAAFGTASMFIEEDVGEKKINTIIPDPVECYIAMNRNGKVDTIFRRFEMTASQAEDEFGYDNLPDPIKKSVEDNPDDQFTFIHAIFPRRKRDEAKEDVYNMPFASYYIQEGGDDIIKESGYRTFPAPTWRFETRGNDPYGYCPTDDAMPEIKTVNNMKYSLLKAGQKSVDPALDIPDSRKDIDDSPGARNYYRDNGREIKKLPSGENFPITLELIQDAREAIKRTYKVDHFLSLIQQDKQMTAREVFERKAEKVTVSGSSIGKFQSEWLEPIAERFLQIEFDAKRMPNPPEKIAQKGYLPLKFEYVGPHAQAMKEVAAAQGIVNTLQTSAILIELFPETKNKIKPEVLIDEIFRSGGIPEKGIRSDEEYQAIQQAMAKQKEELMQMQMQIEQAKAYQGTTKRPEPGSPAAEAQNV